MAPASLRLGVIGMGFGRQVLLPALAGLTDVEVVAVAGGGATETGLPAFPDGAALLSEAAIDAVVVAVPPAAQGALVRQALHLCLPTYCEKPLGLDLAETDALAAAAEAAGVPTAVGFMMRYDAGFAPVLAAVRTGAIGAVRRIEVTWTTSGGGNPARLWTWRDDPAAGGGVLTDFAIHCADYVRLLAGADIASAAARAAARVHDRPTAGGGRRLAPAEDEVDVRLDFRNGVTATLLVSNTAPAGIGHRVEIYGDAGTAIFCHSPPFAPNGAHAAVRTSTGEISLPLLPPEADADTDSRIPALRRLLRDFVAAARGRASANLPNFADALYARRIVADTMSF